MEEYPCPNCELVFLELFELYDHAYQEHGITMGGKKMDEITKEDFIQVDSTWVYAADGAQLILAPNPEGKFRLQIIWTVEPIPPATQYPTEPEWDVATTVANKFKDFQGTAIRREL